MGDSSLPIVLEPSSSPTLRGALSSLEINSQEATLQLLLRITRKYRFLIGACVLGSFFLSLVYVLVATPLFTARAVISIGTYEPVLATTKIEDLLQQKSKENDFLETQIQQLRSLSLADRALQFPGVKQAVLDQRRSIFSRILGQRLKDNAPDSRAGYKTSLPVLENYLSTIEVSPVRRTSLVNISVTHENAQLASLMANAHVAAYIDWLRTGRVDQQSRGVAFLTQQAQELRDRVAELEQQRAEYAEENSIVALNKDENIVVQKMSELNRLLAEATSRNITAQNDYQEASKQIKQDSAGVDDQGIELLRADLARLESQQAQLAQKFNSSYPQLDQLNSQISRLKKSIQDQRNSIVRGLHSKALATENAVKNLKEELEMQKSLAFDLSRKQVQYNAIERELGSSRELLENVLTQIKETSLSLENKGSNVSIVDPAITPLSSSHPRKFRTLIFSIFFGLAVGTGLAFILHHFDNTIRSAEQVMQVTGLPSLGVIPSFEEEVQPFVEDAPSRQHHLTSDDENQHSRHLPDEHTPPEGFRLPMKRTNSEALPIILKKGNGLVTEAYRTVRTSILLSQAGRSPKKILVTSAIPGEGKTTVSVNLATSLATTGSRVVLVDLDLRRPSVSKYFRITRRAKGVVDVVTGQKTIEESLLTTPVENLWVLPSGPIPPNPAELIGADEMIVLLDSLAAKFDHVVIDSAPVLPVSDSLLLAMVADGVVLVVRGEATPGPAVRQAKERLGSLGTRFLGVILNGANIHSGEYGYYGKGYHSYYASAA